MINNFDAAAKLLDCGNPSFDQKYTTFRQKLDLFFIDHEFVPLLIQESYLNCFDEGAGSMADLHTMAEASEMMSVGDLCNIQIRMNQNWNLLPNYGVLSSVAPCQLIKGRCNYPGFPQWLGKNSSARKSKRLIRELKQKMGDKLNTNQYAIQHEAAPMIL
jgi:replication factor C subunit 1